MKKKIVVILFLIVAAAIAATVFYWEKQPSYTLVKVISAARDGDAERIERYIDIEAVSNSVVEEALRLSEKKFSVIAKVEPSSSKARVFLKQMAHSFIRDILNSKTPGFKFKEMSGLTFFLLKTKLFVDFLSQKIVAQSETIVDVSYDLKPLFDQSYLAVFTYKKIGNEWILFEIKELDRH
ncbi:MAG: hypothetical protein KDD37_08760 [Bdellovibrionales bacterium]|nr:hypothetical protein [Bdellovibrionales bacterium]